VRGGQYGISVIRSRDVVIQNNAIEDSRLAGIRIRLSGAEIIGNTITGAQPPYGRGIHVTNTMDWPMTVIRNNIIRNNAGGGIVTNMARVSVWRNTVTDNGARGIGITEMTEATVAENVVERNGENGIYISDQSVAVVCDNTVAGSLLPTIEGAGRYGNGITIDYNAEAELYRNVISGNAQHGISLLESAWALVAENEVGENGAEVLWADESAHWQEGEAAFRCGEPPIRRQ
jgi:parallel beta-helix repeat protein